MTDKIVSAAIKYRIKGEHEFKLVSGNSHTECIELLFCMELYSFKRDMEVEEQGFLTSDNWFVDRYVAKKIALNAGQIPQSYPHELLYSDFIDWSV